MDYLLSRHPIYKSKIDVYAYEVRSRTIAAGAMDEAATEEADRALFSMFSGDRLDQIVGAHPCLIRVTPAVLADELWKSVPANRVVLGYFNDFRPDDAVAQDLLKLSEKGPRLALSGRLNSESLALFGDRAHAIKLDVTGFAPDELERRFQELRRYKAQLLADRVDTYDDLEFCRGLGFDLYEGHFVSRSAVQNEPKQIPVNRLTMMRILSKLQDPELSMPDLEQTISLDVALSYKMLSYANSAAVALPRKVNSVGHAVRLIGINMLRTWTSVLLLSTVDDKPRELMTIALVRARMCEKLAETLKNAQKDSFFSAGLLSVVDALLDCPMEKALAELPLTDEVKSALIGRSGQVGQALRCAVAYEHADWDDVQFYGLPPAPIREIYMEALAWARKLSSGLVG